MLTLYENALKRLPPHPLAVTKNKIVLKETFIELLTNFTNNESLKNELWNEIEKNYASKKRHYHTLQHLGNLLAQLTDVKSEIQN